MRNGSWLAATAAGVACANAFAGVGFIPLYGSHLASSWVELENGELVRETEYASLSMPQSLNFATRTTAAGIEVRAEADYESGWDGRRFFANIELFASTRRMGAPQPFDEAQVNTQVWTHADFAVTEPTAVHVRLDGHGPVAPQLFVSNSFSIVELDTKTPYTSIHFRPTGIAEWRETLPPGLYRIAIESFLYNFAFSESALGLTARSGLSVEIIFAPAPGSAVVMAGLTLFARRRRGAEEASR